MRNFRDTIFLTSIHLLCISFLAVGATGCQPAGNGIPAPDSTAPARSAEEAGPVDFVLPTIDGDSLRMADYNGKVVLLNFWATWCAPCRHEIPDLIDLYEELGPDDFAVIGISLDEADTDLVRQFVEDMEINYPIALDQMGAVAEIFGGVYALPTTFVLDRNGGIVHRTIGLFPTTSMKEELVTLIEES